MESTITDRLREGIRRSGASLREIDEATGVDYTHLSRWLRGERGVTGEQVDVLAKWLGAQLEITPKHRRKKLCNENTSSTQ